MKRITEAFSRAEKTRAAIVSNKSVKSQIMRDNVGAVTDERSDKTADSISQ